MSLHKLKKCILIANFLIIQHYSKGMLSDQQEHFLQKENIIPPPPILFTMFEEEEEEEDPLDYKPQSLGNFKNFLQSPQTLWHSYDTLERELIETPFEEKIKNLSILILDIIEQSSTELFTIENYTKPIIQKHIKAIHRDISKMILAFESFIQDQKIILKNNGFFFSTTENANKLYPSRLPNLRDMRILKMISTSFKDIISKMDLLDFESLCLMNFIDHWIAKSKNLLHKEVIKKMSNSFDQIYKTSSLRYLLNSQLKIIVSIPENHFLIHYLAIEKKATILLNQKSSFETFVTNLYLKLNPDKTLPNLAIEKKATILLNQKSSFETFVINLYLKLNPDKTLPTEDFDIIHLIPNKEIINLPFTRNLCYASERYPFVDWDKYLEIKKTERSSE